MSHTLDWEAPARLKNPFYAPWEDWKPFAETANMHVAGLGPLFFLFLVTSILCLPVFYFRKSAWLLFMLLLLLFIQPYAWQMRYAPFLWFLPLAFLLPVPNERRYLLWVPFSVALINTFGVFCLFTGDQWMLSRIIRQVCAPHAGETVLLDRSVFEWNGIFDQFGIKQKYANPEETFFGRLAPELGSLSKARTARGVNISFAEDLLPVPETPLVFAEEAALPWLKMSEGLMPVEVSLDLSSDLTSRIEWRTYADKVKFYMSLDKNPESDWELLLDGAVFDEGRSAPRELSVSVFINNKQIGTWKIDGNSKRGSFSIPQKLMEESFRDEMRLVTLMLRLPNVPSLIENYFEVSAYGLRLDGMQMRPSY
jgi:hypothetical protein